MILDLVNMVPPDTKLSDLSDRFSRLALNGIPTIWDGEERDPKENNEEQWHHSKAVYDDYVERVGGINNAVEAYRLVASCLESLPLNFQRRVWESELKFLSQHLEDVLRGEKPTVASLLFPDDDELQKLEILSDKETTEEKIESIQNLLETCLFLQNSKEACVRLRELLSKDEALLEDDRYWDTVRSAERFYTFVRDSRQKLQTIAGMTSADPFNRSIISAIRPLKTSGRIELDERDILRVVPDQFAEAIEGVRSTHIRKCLICMTIFWAGRRDSKCCSSNCADKNRKRQHRARYKERLLAEWQKERQTDEHSGEPTQPKRRSKK